MKVATWNVNGIRAREAQVREWVERERPGIICLQELKAPAGQVPAGLCEGYWCYWHAETSYSGVGLHLRKDVFPEAPVFRPPAFDHENRIVTAQVGTLVVASVYVPNGGKDFAAKLRFLEALEGYAAEVHAGGLELIICGDLNVTRADMDVHPKERKADAIGQRPDERARLERILERGLVDVGRALDPDNDTLFTWWAPWRNHRQRNIGWRLDYVLASAPVARRAVACPVLADIGTSDHAPLVATFELTLPVTG